MKALFVPVALLLFVVKTSAQVPVFNSYPSASAVLFLDFDGHYMEGTNWNLNGPLYLGPSNLNPSQMTEVYNRIAEDYRPFNLNVTTDSAVYEAAPIDHRMRIVFTITSDWYGVAGGVAYTNSFTWGNNTPCFVFTALHKYNVKNISEAGAHEAGHTLGLRHQALYDSTCRKVSDYNSGTGSGVVGWAPIMGVGYSRNYTTWHHGPNPYGCTNEQDDLAIITSERNGFGYRPDEDSATDFSAAPVLNSDTNTLNATGLITTNNDSDLFKFLMPANGQVTLDVDPYSIAANDQGSNLDVQVQLYNSEHQLIQTYNPEEALHVTIDTTLASGAYYITVSGASSPFASNYASLGAYSIRGSVPPPAPVYVRMLQLSGSASDHQQQLNWVVAADAPITKQVVERLNNDGAFSPVDTLSPEARSYTITTDKTAEYRLHVFFDYDRQQYSNNLTLKHIVLPAKPQLYTNVIRNNTLLVNSPASYVYSITNVTGQLLQRGTINKGATTINMSFSKTGLYIISFEKEGQQFAQKFMRD
jgi:hypothetical protein